MGVCVNCIYHLGNSQVDCFQGFKRISGHQCTNPNNQRTDFITGHQFNGDCYELNNFEECRFFDDGKVTYTYYAWKKADEIYYTEEKNPTINSKLLSTPDIQSNVVIDEAPDFYAFRSTSNNVIYSKIRFANLSVTDKVYTSNNEELGEIESVSYESIIFNDTVYYYNPSYNKVHKVLIINGKVFIRSSIDDVFIEKTETETDTPTEGTEDTDTSTDNTDKGNVDTSADDTIKENTDATTDGSTSEGSGASTDDSKTEEGE